MTLPIRSFRRKDLKDLETIEGSHKITKVSFTENGIKKIGYFKELEPKNHFPELLAKISVASSEMCRTFLGEYAAAECLVFDNREKIVGILSTALENFKPFNYATETPPSDPQAREEVIPSTKTLLERNFMAAAFLYWFLDNDDGHPHNYGFSGKANNKKTSILDYDMFFYWCTEPLKGGRPGITKPKKRIQLTVTDWERAPRFRDSLVWHNPAYDYPGQETLPALPGVTRLLPKQFADPSQFQQMAREAISHAQKFAMGMEVLHAFQPQIIRNRLFELFAVMPLNYTSLDETDAGLRVTYERDYPEFFNSTTNAKPFVDFFMSLVQEHYDNLYRVVVFYMGCDNNGFGVGLNPTCLELFQKPSIYRNIESWMEKMNETIYSNAPPGIKFNLAELPKRYHQVWRDAYTPTVEQLLESCHKLVNNLLSELSSTKASLREISGKHVNDSTFTYSLQMLSSMPDLSRKTIEPLISVDKDSKYREGLLLLVDFTQQFQNLVRTYYGKQISNLCEEDNLHFYQGLNKLSEEYDLRIRQSLLHTTTQATTYHGIAQQLKQLIERINFPLHLLSTDEQMKNTLSTNVRKVVLNHTHPDVIQQYCETLFNWAKSLPPAVLEKYINEIIDKYYAPFGYSIITWRHRVTPVKEYLKKYKHQNGADKLAYIFCTGTDNSVGALDSSLVEHLTPIMLERHSLPSLKNAKRDGVFNVTLYANAVLKYAKNDKQFTHLKSVAGCEQFYRTFYGFINNLRPLILKSIIFSALQQYEDNKWLKTGRRDEIENYFTESMPQDQIVASIFYNRDQNPFNVILFDKLIGKMKNDCRLKYPGYQLLDDYDPQVHKEIYAALHDYSKEIAERPQTRTLEYKTEAAY